MPTKLATALLPLLLAACPDPPDVERDASPFDGAADTHAPDAALPGCKQGWCAIPAGSFTMGSPASEPFRTPFETQHKVTLTRGFLLAETETTQGQFEKAMGYNPAWFFKEGTCKQADCPAESLSWHEAAAYCNALSAAAGSHACYSCTGSGDAVTCATESAYAGKGKTIYDCKGFRLPTEAEWEYAFRAGTTTALYSGALSGADQCKDKGADAIGWYLNNSSKQTHPARQKQPNAWGLFDMAGNVFEWCHDGYNGDHRPAAVTDPVGAPSGSSPAKGGCFAKCFERMRAADRNPFAHHEARDYHGFRCARTLTP